MVAQKEALIKYTNSQLHAKFLMHGQVSWLLDRLVVLEIYLMFISFLFLLGFNFSIKLPSDLLWLLCNTFNLLIRITCFWLLYLKLLYMVLVINVVCVLKI